MIAHFMKTVCYQG